MNSPLPSRIERVGQWVAARQLALIDAVFLIVAGVLFVTAFSIYVPFNMDEFIHYDALICPLFPQTDIGDGACGYFDLQLPGTNWTVPIRAYHYSGSAPSLYYLPLLLLWKSPLSARFLGLIFVFFEAWILARVMGMRKLPVVLGLLAFFPYAFQQIVDTGPVGFHMLSIFLLYALFGRWAKTLRPRYMVGSALIAAFCVWIKFSYFWLVPGICILFLVQTLRYKPWKLGRSAEIILQPLASAALVLLPLAILITSVNPRNPAERPYLDQLLNSESYTLHEMLNIDWLRTPIGNMFLSPSEAAQRIFIVQPTPVTLDLAFQLLTYMFVPLFVLLLALVGLRYRNRGIWIPAMLYAAFFSAVFMICRTKASGAMHHAILAFPFLLLAAGETLRLLRERPGAIGRMLRWVAIVCGILFLAVNLTYWTLMPTQPQHLGSDSSKDVLSYVMNDTEVAKRYIIVVVDWGVFFIQGLYGDPEQIVLFRWGVSPDEVTRLKALAAERGRKLLFVHSQPETAADLGLLRPLATEMCNAVPPNARWQIIGEPDPILTKVCLRVARKGR